ncbi:MAG: hypothetical protein ABW068_16985, partial [Candidatus Thiodiazotropha sp.]
APTARRVSSIASRLPGTTSLRFAFPGWQRRYDQDPRMRNSVERNTNARFMPDCKADFRA